MSIGLVLSIDSIYLGNDRNWVSINTFGLYYNTVSHPCISLTEVPSVVLTNIARAWHSMHVVRCLRLGKRTIII